ncbi:hypothetical protein AAL_07685 [Moelleriella libera RCEF 2490]|uniref:Uncharacterized protein n=1 Tax=Moelleriella libera RCEF 2490 TaxID=1081109 RepID=A0A167WXD8_9HYPO|nr:hypothetical protein AAL_07685 [Moelleriella libera RCEF 2490]
MEAHEEDSAPYYCITEARCRLCQFALRDNELVYAGDDRVSGESEFQQQRSIYDEDLNINIHMCLGDNCLSRIKATVCFHSRCYKVRSYTVTPAFLDATQYAFIAPPHEEQRRADYIRRALAQNLQKAAGWPSTLPLELWLMIAALLVQECAVVTTEERVHCDEAVGDSMLDLEQPVYATYVKVDGRYYVQRLLNAPETNGGKQAYLLLPARTQKQGQDDVGHGKDLFVAEDHVGIRQVVFVSPHHRDEWCRCHPNIPGAWWRHIPRGAIFSNITIKTNVGDDGA